MSVDRDRSQTLEVVGIIMGALTPTSTENKKKAYCLYSTWKSLAVPKKRAARTYSLLRHHLELFGHPGPGCRLVVFLEGDWQNRPE